MPCEVTQEPFGHTQDGKSVTRFTLRNSSGQLVVRILDYGGVINEINVPDRHGNVADVTLGCDDMEGYETRSRFFGALIGRVANRIAGGQFTLDGKTYTLCVNNWPNSLHGGQVGFDKKVWTSRVEGDSLVLTYVSPDGEENYPGEVTTKVVYRVTDDNELSIEYEATTTKPTPLNLTNHAYFNLAGHDSGTLADNVVTIAADSYLPIDDTSIPTGEVRPVDGTEYDLRRPVRLGDRMHKVRKGKGFDHNFCLAPSDGKVRLAARLEHPPSGRFMECLTTEPGLQFYTGGNLEGQRGKGGASYGPFSALAMEAQHYPDSVNHPSFPSTIVRPGETYRQTTVYTFGVA
ncbi:galactose mutarotase-like [Littorina saxatilis]|uniref:Aldose 1-epimerase n=1 Tax=Littorina saxatilis TaxID=31220 RepID=A0AAN9B3M0_9CAEN